MGWLSWLFDEEKEQREPEILVLGAELNCPYGSRNSFLYVQTEDIQLDHLPEACEILMKTEETWQNPLPQTKLVNGKEIITTESFLVCKGSGMNISIYC